jgi:hypothetical protein
MSPSDKQVWQWLDKISKPQPKLNGNAICPWIQHFRHKIMVVKSDTPDVVIENFAVFKQTFALEAVVIYGFRMNYDQQYAFINKLNKRYKKRDVFLLGMRPDSEEPPLPLEYNYKRPLIIAQKLSTLKMARQQTAKNTDYYSHYNN